MGRGLGVPPEGAIPEALQYKREAIAEGLQKGVQGLTKGGTITEDLNKMRHHRGPTKEGLQTGGHHRGPTKGGTLQRA